VIRTAGGGVAALAIDGRGKFTSKTAVSTIVISAENGHTRHVERTSHRSIAGIIIVAASQNADAATTIHASEAAGLMARQCQAGAPNAIGLTSLPREEFRDLLSVVHALVDHAAAVDDPVV